MALSDSELERIDLFFHPESVAIVGASGTPGKFGYQVVRNLLNLGYRGRIYPINPKLNEIQGVKAFPSVVEVPDTIRTVVVCVPSHVAPSVMMDCERKGVKNIIIIASGFDEAGPEGQAHQREVLNVARRAGMRIVGPNTTGILNPAFGFTSTFVPLETVKAGNVSFISQTGMFAGMMMEWMVSCQEFGLRKVAGLGNKCDVADHEILHYLARDEGTRVILLHMEGTKRGKEFFQALRAVTRIKPVVVLKVGQTEAGARAMTSHTASLAADSRVFNAMLKQCGAIRVGGLEELVDIGKTFGYLPLPAGDGATSISLSGGAGVMAADALVENGLSVKRLNNQTLTKIREKSPVWANPSNPLDIEPLIEKAGFVEGYRIGLDALLSDKAVDSCIVQHGTMIQSEDEIQFVFEAREKYPHKPIAVCILGDKRVYDELFTIYERNRVPVFSSVERAARALGALYHYRRYLDRL